MAVEAATGSESAARPYLLANTEVFTLPAKALGRRYSYIVTLPTGYAANPHRRYPVLMYTDAPQSVQLITGLHRRLRAGGRGLEDAVFVGLGYAEGDTGEFSRRRDYTPTPHGDLDAKSDMPGRRVEYGQAEAYRLHLRDELFPELEKRYRIDPTRRIYLGHSYGGLFGTHILLREPEMFQKYALISPSLWYGRKLMLARERGYATLHRDMRADVFFMIGGEETVVDPDSQPFSTSRFDMVGDMREMVANLQARRYPGLHVRERVFEGEDHASVYVPAVWSALKWALPGSGKTPHQPCLDSLGKPIVHCRMPWAPQPK